MSLLDETPPPERWTLGLRDHGAEGILRPCSRPDCKRPVHAKGLCRCHYKRQRAGARLDLPIRRNRWAEECACVAPGCERAADKRGLCSMHYQRRRDGVPFDAPPRVTRRRQEPIEGQVYRVKATLRLTRKARAAVAAEAERRGLCVAAVLREVVETWARGSR